MAKRERVGSATPQPVAVPASATRTCFAGKFWLLALALMLVIGIYAYTAPLGMLEASSLHAADTYYNLLVQGFRAGQLNLRKEVPPGFAQLVDPYDPEANAPYRILPYRMSDLSYYKGRLYLYFGVTPALILFWPYVALTSHYLFDRQAVTIFCAIGVLASVGLLRALWRRYFAEVSVGVVVACGLALGLATGIPSLLPRSDIYEVAISCGYMLTMLALAAIWRALHEPERAWRWLAAASVAYGLAVGARPDLLFGAVILLVPVAQAWRERRKVGALVMAATGPIILIGLGLMLYNALRFDSPFEFGCRYTLASRRVTGQLFNLHYLWFNFGVYFLEPAHWSTRFPLVHKISMPPLPAGHFGAEESYGVLTNIPLVWAALAVPLAWRGRVGQAGSILRWFVAAVALLFGICALTLCSVGTAELRHAVDFLPALVLLAVVGILGLERVLAPTSESGQARRLVRRRIVRCGWGVLLGFSVAFNVLVSVERYAVADCALATMLALQGRVPEAIQILEKALRVAPDYADGYSNLGYALQKAGRVEEAIGHYEQALRLNPDDAETHYDLGVALAQLGRIQEAIGHWEQALRCRPDDARAHNNLGATLGRLGKVQEAIPHFEQALRINPNYAKAHYNLGTALERAGRLQEAIGHYEWALRLEPDYADARDALAKLQAGQ